MRFKLSRTHNRPSANVIFLLATLFLLTACGDPQLDTNIRVTGLRTYAMDYHAAEQHQSNWCWAASVQMVLSTFGLDIDQETIVIRTFGQAIDHPGGPIHILHNLNGWSVGSGTSRLQATCFAGPPALEFLQMQLQNNIPVIVGFRQPGAAIGHAVVITAVIYETTPQGPKIVKVMVRDPSPMFRSQNGKRELLPREFASINQHYIVARF